MPIGDHRYKIESISLLGVYAFLEFNEAYTPIKTLKQKGVKYMPRFQYD